MMTGLLLAVAVAPLGHPGAPADRAALEPYVQLALECVHREYPNKIGHVLSSDADVAPPRELTPAFYGCFDWHSSVHGHWLLARYARLFPSSVRAAEARTALRRSLTLEHVAEEIEYLRGAGRASFERPYGLAWLLQLDAELFEWGGEAVALREALAPLAAEVGARFREWLPKLAYPIRTGEHSQTAFAFGLVLDWARTVGDEETASLVIERSRSLYLGDRNAPLGYEPSGQDFLSPALAEADLVRRFLGPVDFAAWLGGFLPGVPLSASSSWLPAGVVTDRSDPKLAHLDGLNLSRAWMLEGIAAGLPPEDPRRGALLAAAALHRQEGLVGVESGHYEGGHWLGTFAIYLLTRRGLEGGVTNGGE